MNELSVEKQQMIYGGNIAIALLLLGFAIPYFKRKLTIQNLLR